MTVSMETVEQSSITLAKISLSAHDALGFSFLGITLTSIQVATFSLPTTEQKNSFYRLWDNSPPELPMETTGKVGPTAQNPKRYMQGSHKELLK